MLYSADGVVNFRVSWVWPLTVSICRSSIELDHPVVSIWPTAVGCRVSDEQCTGPGCHHLVREEGREGGGTAGEKRKRRGGGREGGGKGGGEGEERGEERGGVGEGGGE